MGPLLAAFITTTLDWPIPFWVYFAENVLCLTLIACFLQETYYDRTIPAEQQPPRGSRVNRLVGVAQWRSRHLRNTFGQACWRVVSVLLKPTVAITCVYYMLVRN
jgi:predicted MFS family arabinose efflux permease